jgi:hypothetical protein
MCKFLDSVISQLLIRHLTFVRLRSTLLDNLAFLAEEMTSPVTPLPLPDDLALFPDALLSSLDILLDTALILFVGEMFSPFINLLDDLTLFFDVTTSFTGLRRSALLGDRALTADDGAALLVGLRRSTLPAVLTFLSDAALSGFSRSSSLDEPLLLFGDVLRSSSATLDDSSSLPL